MQRLIKLLNSYPGHALNETDFEFSPPVYDPLTKEFQVLVSGKLQSNAYVRQFFKYKPFDLTKLSQEHHYSIVLNRETNVHEALPLINRVVALTYQLDQNGVQWLKVPLLPVDLEPLSLPGDSGTVEIPGLHYLVYGKLKLSYTRDTKPNQIESLGFHYSVLPR